MTPELTALALVALEHLVLVGWSQKELTKDVGEAGNMGPRDEALQLSVRTGRLRRALANHTENFPLFIGAVLIVTLSGHASAFTATCAFLYVIARALYIPAYAFAWVPWRSVLYMIGLLATLVLYIAAFV